MFAYCLNNPVNTVDSNGSSPLAISGSYNQFYSLLSSTLPVIGMFFTIATLFASLFSSLFSRYSSSSSTTDSSSATKPNWGQLLKDYEEEITKRLDEALGMPFNITYDYARHHIVAKKAWRAKPSRVILESVGIGLNSSDNIILIKTEAHYVIHTALYYEWVNLVIKGFYEASPKNVADQKEGGLNALQYIKKALDRYTPQPAK